jgi:hypothetical protein
MNEQEFPPGWDAARVQRLIAHYDSLDEDSQVAEDEAALEPPGHTLMAVPVDLVPVVRDLIARHTGV